MLTCLAIYLSGLAVIGLKDCTSWLQVEDILDQVFKVFSFLDNGTIGKIYTSMRVVSLTVFDYHDYCCAYKYIFKRASRSKGRPFQGCPFCLFRCSTSWGDYI